jgi:hypothetical protein
MPNCEKCGEATKNKKFCSTCCNKDREARQPKPDMVCCSKCKQYKVAGAYQSQRKFKNCSTCRKKTTSTRARNKSSTPLEKKDSNTIQIEKLYSYLLEKYNIEESVQDIQTILEYNQNTEQQSVGETNTLVYLGCGWDCLPLFDKRFVEIDTFLFVDPLPNTPHYEPLQAGFKHCKDLETYIESFENGLPPGSQRQEIDGNTYKYSCPPTRKNGKPRLLLLYANTNTKQALADEYLREMIHGCSYLYISGFDPCKYGLHVEDVPNAIVLDIDDEKEDLDLHEEEYSEYIHNQ